MNTFAAQGENATCMTASQVAALWPSDWDACSSVMTGLYDSIYVDALQARRNLLMGLLVIYAAPSSLECQTSSLTVSCLMKFRQCSMMTVPNGAGGTEQVPVAQPVCREFCDRWSIDCLFTYDVTPAYILFNCSTPSPNLWDNYTNPNMFPRRDDPIVQVSSISAPSVAVNETIPCFYHTNISAAYSQVCPSPLFNDPSSRYCSLGCPLPLISDSEYRGLEIMMSVFGWISFVLTAFLIATYLIDKTKRVYPAILPLFFVFCINGTSFAFCLGNMVGHEDVWCENDATPYDFGGGACTVQGIIWVYFTMAGVFWWTVIAVNLMLMLVWPRFKEFMAKWYHIYHFVWLLPIITLIIALANQKLGYGGDVWCSVHIGPASVSYSQSANGIQVHQDDTAYLWNLLLMIVPIFCLVFVGMVCITVVLVYMGINYKNLGWGYLATQWRLFVFLMFYIYIYVFVFAFQIELIVQKDDQYSAFGEYINCNLLALFNFTLDCQLTQYVNYPLWVIVVFNASAQGIFVFIIFGTTLQVYKAWLHLFWIDRLFGFSGATSSGGSTTMTKIQGKIVSSSKSAASLAANSEMLDDSDIDGKEDSSSEETNEKAEDSDDKKEEEEDKSEKASEKDSSEDSGSDN